jgi:hypothetical protein
MRAPYVGRRLASEQAIDDRCRNRFRFASNVTAGGSVQRRRILGINRR